MRLFGQANGSMSNDTPIQTDAQLESIRPAIDVEKQNSATDDTKKTSVFEGLGWLDRFLAAWIFLAMLVGILLGNFVPSTGPALQKGTFVGVSVPIGEEPGTSSLETVVVLNLLDSCWVARHDVPDPLQGAVRNTASCLPQPRHLDPDFVQHLPELDRCAVSDGRGLVASPAPVEICLQRFRAADF